MIDITAPVGDAQPNRTADVKLVQELLNRNIKALAPLAALDVTGVVDAATLAAIRAFQGKVVKLASPDGVISPGRATIKRLVEDASPPPIAPAGPSGADRSAMNEAEIVAAAAKIGCEVAAVKAVILTEVGIRGAFDALGRPIILYERHYFSELTGRRFDKTHPDISNPKSGGYGKFSAQYPKLERAIALDRNAALQSASWGAFQIMGRNFKAAGYPTVEAFVAAVKDSLSKKIEGFGNFVVADPRLRAALQARQWTTFARIYNGPGFAANQYDLKMKQNYELIRQRP